MQESGLDKLEVIKILEEKLKSDYSYDSGSILGSMCTEPLDFGKEIYAKFISKNLGDPGLFPGTAKLEEELVSNIGALLGNNNIIGTITTGGSEANLIAMRIAKKLRPDIKKPEIVLPVSSHISFDKAADLLGIKLRKARLMENYEVNIEHFEELINENTCGVIGVAGTTSLGLVDPIRKIGEIIDGKNIYFHVDAAFGGFVLPFLKHLGREIPEWDFTLDSVDSITADPHKMGLAVIPSGGFFIRDRSILKKAGFEIPYLAGGAFKHFHIVGTRPGGAVISFWAIMKHLGMDGFSKIIDNCMKNTEYLVNRINEIEGIKLVVTPVMNVVGITTENGEEICKLDEEIRKKEWLLGKFDEFNLVRIVIMPHVKRNHLTEFCNDLEVIAKKLFD